jgi:metal-dependent hydrolase (beta-lactamase superfamily II)
VGQKRELASKQLRRTYRPALTAMRRYEVNPNGISAVFISHLHGDQFGG